MKSLYILLTVCLIGFTGCASFHYHGSYVAENSNQPTGGGLYRVFDNGTVQVLNNGNGIDLPTSTGGLRLRYDAQNHEGAHVTSINWLVDKQHKDTNPMNVLIYGNPGNGAHIISCIITWAWAGDNRFAACDTISLTVNTSRDNW